MPTARKAALFLLFAAPMLVSPSLVCPSLVSQTQPPAAARPPAIGLLTAAEAARILPATVFFRGLAAPIQARNAGGVRFDADPGRLLLVTLVDTSGYSTSVKEKYQAYLLTEKTLDIEGHRLPPGAYGCGFIVANGGADTFIVEDIGAHDLFTAPATRDAALRRPTPLQLLAGPNGAFRLYAGRTYITLKPAAD